MRCLVTGGAGFIGSHLVDRLIEEKHEVVIIDDESSDNDLFYWNKDSKHVKCDITKYDKLVGHFEGIDIVFHLAAESRLQPAILNPERACYVNYIGTFNVLEASRKHNIKKVIYSSTSSAYGLNTPPLSEDMKEDCLNPYAATKVSAETLCKVYNNLYGLNTITFRYFNVYGERMPDKGQYAPVIAIFLRQIKNNEPMTIIGDGIQKRDFIHVKDVVEANIKAMYTENENVYGKVYNVGSGKNNSILNISKMIGKNYIFLPFRDGEASDNLANIDKIKKDLQWQPTVDLEEWLRGLDKK